MNTPPVCAGCLVLGPAPGAVNMGTSRLSSSMMPTVGGGFVLEEGVGPVDWVVSD